jgi:hypothetical protein
MAPLGECASRTVRGPMGDLAFSHGDGFNSFLQESRL